MKKLTKILLLSASMILTSCGKPAESKPTDSTPATSTPAKSETESKASSNPTSSSQAPATSSSSKPASSSSQTPVLGGWTNDGAKVGEAQPVKNASANLKGYELTATGKELASGKWDNGKLKGDIEWGVTGMTAGKYQIYLKGEYSANNGSHNFVSEGDIPEGLSRYTFQADSEAEAVITESESYQGLGWKETGSGAVWTNKSLAEIDIKAGTTKFAIRYHASGYSVYLAAVRLVKVGDLPAGPASSTPASSTVPSSSESTVPNSSESTEPEVPADGSGTVTLADGASTLSEGADGITIDNTTNEIHFTKKGVYAVAGTLTNGSLIVDAEVGEGSVELDLGNVTLTRTGDDVSAPIVGRHAGKLKVKKDGKNTVQTITDNRTLSKKAPEAAAIYAKGYLDMPGKGAMTINAVANGIESEKYIEAKNGTLNITAAKKGVYARRSILLGEEGGAFNIDATGQAIEIEAVEGATFEEEELKGVCLAGGTFDIKSATKKGINSDYTVQINGGSGTIEALADRPINAKADLKIADGEFTYKGATNNAIKADLGATISGGKHTMESDVKALISLGDIDITGGEVYVTKATDAIEGKNVTISGETTIVEVKATANGINATLPATAEATAETPTITIEGGYTYVESLGDGLDSNGDIIITGGTTVINQSGEGNTAIDYGETSEFKQDGGLLVAYGANEGAPVNTGTQRSIIAASTGCTTGNFFKVANGETTYFVKPQTATAYQLYISSPEFADGTVTVSQLASATEGVAVYKGVFSSATEEGEATVLGTGAWTSNNLHLNTIPAA